ncbi:hypothetical protein [Luteolibacter sp. Populi]|uniref:hypothetical protein n=1 Tax=Luteolibacter sp. Populi TaxID=3230487 RepID=UPI00346637B3
MILPQTLSPLPVSPSGNRPEVSPPFEDFVSAGDVRKVILGTSEFPVSGLPADDFEFAGRADIPLPERVAKWKPKPREVKVELEVADLALETPVVHPAFEVIPPARRAAPPQLRERADCEAAYGRSKPNERWWVIGMGLAACAVLFSGTLVDFIYREALRRSHVEAIVLPKPAVKHAADAVVVAAGAEEKEKPAPLAATAEADEE